MKLYSKVKQKLIALCMLAVLATTLVTGCGTSADSGATKQTAANLSLDEITKKAKEEGKIVSVGMPDSWANWKDTWNDLSKIYGLQHTDTDMSSAEEIAKFEAEKDKPTADIGDIGLTFAPVAVTKGVTQPYKTSYWNDIPAWAKDKDGHWIVGYQGTIAFIVNKKIVKDPPKSWADLLKGNYKVAVGDVSKAAQAQNAILATALALGGNESNIEPALDFYAQLAKQKGFPRWIPVSPTWKREKLR